MSTTAQLYERFAPEIEKACREGRGKEVLDDYFKAVAEHFAEAVFLKLDAELKKQTEETIDDFAAWVEQFPYEQGLDLIERLTSTMRSFNATEEQIGEAANLTAVAYQQRLDFLFQSSYAGGAA